MNKKPDFGPMLIDHNFNLSREKNAISYLLGILEVKQRGEYIVGIDGGPGMDTLEGAAFRVANLINKLRENNNDGT